MIYKYYKEWYEQVTPRIKRKIHKSNVDWQSRYDKYLGKTKKAAEDILNKPGNPERICGSSIRRECGLTAEMFNVKLKKTAEFIKNATESIDEYGV